MRIPSIRSTASRTEPTATSSPGCGRRPRALKTRPAMLRAPSWGSCVPMVALKSSMVIDPATTSVSMRSGRRREVVLAFDLADDLLQDVPHGHDAGRPAVFVDHDRELLARLTQLAQQRAEILGLGDDERRCARSPTGKWGSRRAAATISCTCTTPTRANTVTPDRRLGAQSSAQSDRSIAARAVTW